MSVPGFPNSSSLRPDTNRGTGSVIYTVEAAMSHVPRPSRARAQPSKRESSSAASAAEQFDRELRAALSKSVWHTGGTSWYVDENGNDPNQWPWLWSTYSRRTARLEPGGTEVVAS